MQPNPGLTPRRLPSLAVPGILLACAVVMVAAVELLAGDYVQRIVIGIGINVILVVSLNLSNGFTGVFSLGHVGFMAIGAYTAALNGLDTLIFSGGIGENSALIRERICNGLEFLGLELDSGLNNVNAPLISTNASRVSVRVIKTDEELQMARSVRRLLQ